MKSLKVVIINKSESTGGAAVASLRLYLALKKNDIDATLLVQDMPKKPATDAIVLDNNSIRQNMSMLRFIQERVMFLRHEKSKDLRYAFSPANVGVDISTHPAVQEADIIHLNWINQGFLSLKSIEKLFALGKPIVWTLHDMWAFTGGCHYAGYCHGFLENCGNCPMLKTADRNDLSSIQFFSKMNIYKRRNLTIVTCSKWLRSLANESSLLRDKPVKSIPNPLDTNIFKPLDKMECRKQEGLPTNKKLILFGAANVNDVRKGMDYLIEALQLFKQRHADHIHQVELVIFGKVKSETMQMLGIPFHQLNYVNNLERLIQVYNAADIFVLPSLQDNLPNTVAEAMGCGVPVVAFKTGGVPEMIDHQRNGYLAESKNSLDLADGIFEVLFNPNNIEYSKFAREKAVFSYSEDVVAAEYLKVYNDALKQ